MWANFFQAIFIFILLIWHWFLGSIKQLPERIAIDIETKLTSKVFKITDIVFDPYTDEIEFDILPLSSGLTKYLNKRNMVFYADGI